MIRPLSVPICLLWYIIDYQEAPEQSSKLKPSVTTGHLDNSNTEQMADSMTVWWLGGKVLNFGYIVESRKN